MRMYEHSTGMRAHSRARVRGGTRAHARLIRLRKPTIRSAGEPPQPRRVATARGREGARVRPRAKGRREDAGSEGCFVSPPPPTPPAVALDVVAPRARRHTARRVPRRRRDIVRIQPGTAARVPLRLSPATVWPQVPARGPCGARGGRVRELWTLHGGPRGKGGEADGGQSAAHGEHEQ